MLADNNFDAAFMLECRSWACSIISVLTQWGATLVIQLREGEREPAAARPMHARRHFNMGRRLNRDIADGQREVGELDHEASEVLRHTVSEHRERRVVGSLRGSS